MLKTTYRPSAAPPPLPEGWTEHTAPTGHKYYYNAETKQSTYTRPVASSEEHLQIDYNATEPDQVVSASMRVMEDFHKKNDQRAQQHFAGQHGFKDRPRRRDGDRPKTKAVIPNCVPWLLVKTKYGRRFVHNTETKQSLWKFPQDVMMAVIEMDRLEWEAKKKAESGETNPETTGESSAKSAVPPKQDSYDSDSYEEVEVTDDDEEVDGEASTKRPRFSEDEPNEQPSGPVEFDEDDIAYQLAEMENDYEDEYGEADEEEGLPITEQESISLFRSLLDDAGLNPYTVFDKVIEDNTIIEDPRYTSLPNMSRRREVFAEWSRDRIAEHQERQKHQPLQTTDPKISYLSFLHKNATPKLYWPEFRRKFKKEAEMKDVNFSDKDREKLYREYINKLKLGEPERRKELVALLKSVDVKELNRQSQYDRLPDVVRKDLRYILLPEKKRDELIAAHIATLSDR